ncbi:MAG TPA: hypothetical protein PLK82_00600 [Bacteroidales bacterium]|nr:hypothetical protein [Bacteroidales bacterium]
MAINRTRGILNLIGNTGLALPIKGSPVEAEYNTIMDIVEHTHHLDTRIMALLQRDYLLLIVSRLGVGYFFGDDNPVRCNVFIDVVGTLCNSKSSHPLDIDQTLTGSGRSYYVQVSNKSSTHLPGSISTRCALYVEITDKELLRRLRKRKLQRVY